MLSFHSERVVLCRVAIMKRLKKGVLVILIYASDFSSTNTSVCTGGTCKIVIIVGVFHEKKMQSTLPLIFFMAVGIICIPRTINKCKSFGAPKSRTLAVFQSLSGCDTISAFNSRGKNLLGKCGRQKKSNTSVNLKILSATYSNVLRLLIENSYD